MRPGKPAGGRGAGLATCAGISYAAGVQTCLLGNAVHHPLTELPALTPRGFLDFPVVTDLDALDAHIAILGVPFGMPYEPAAMANEQSRAPDALRRVSSLADIRYTRAHFDWDLGGPLLDGRDVRVVDCGNVTAVAGDHREHYRRAEQAARRIVASGAILVGLGGDHGVSIPLLRALEEPGQPVTLVHVDAHIDWRHEINGETEGYSSPIRRASEMPWIRHIVQIGMRGIGSARTEEVAQARAWGAQIIDAYEVHAMGMQSVLERIPDRGPYYLSIDADGLDPTIMPAVMAPTPGGLDWLQIHQLIHGLVRKGPVLGMDLVEIAPVHDLRNLSLLNAERLVCNFIGACVRAGHCSRA
jgi:agmatinase